MKKLFIGLLLAVMGSPCANAQGLKDVYKDYFMIGVAVNQRNVSNPDQVALIKQEFNSMTAENDMKPEPTEPREGEFNWENADRIANFARANGIKLVETCKKNCAREGAIFAPYREGGVARELSRS